MKAKYTAYFYSTQSRPVPRFGLLQPVRFLDAGAASHSFASFFAGNTRLDISFLPTREHLVQGKYMPKLKKVPGRLYSHAETLEIDKSDLKTFGPFEISEELYCLAEKRVEFLKRGETFYKMIPTNRWPALRNEPGGNINCMLALSDIAGEFHPRLLFGEAGMKAIIVHFRQAGFAITEIDAPSEAVAGSVQRRSHY